MLENSNHRKIKLRRLLKKAQKLQDTAGEGAVNEIKEIMVKSEDLLKIGKISERANNTDEVLLDATLIFTVSGVGIKAVDNIELNLDSYDSEELANRFFQHLQCNNKIWSHFEDEIIFNFDLSPSYMYMYGLFKSEHFTVNLQQKAKSKQKKRKKLETYTNKTPECIYTLDKTEDGVDETVKIMLCVLKKLYKESKKPISYFNFVINPNDFGKTVENIFHFSFLIRDGAVKLEYDQNNIPFVSPVSYKTSQKRPLDADFENTQRVMSIDLNSWKEIISALNINECLCMKNTLEEIVV